MSTAQHPLPTHPLRSNTKASGFLYDLREIDRAGVKESCVRVFFIRVMSRQRSQKNPDTGLERAVARPRDTTLKRSHSATTQCTTNNSTLTR